MEAVTVRLMRIGLRRLGCDLTRAACLSQLRLAYIRRKRSRPGKLQQRRYHLYQPCRGALAREGSSG